MQDDLILARKIVTKWSVEVNTSEMFFFSRMSFLLFWIKIVTSFFSLEDMFIRSSTFNANLGFASTYESVKLMILWWIFQRLSLGSNKFNTWSAENCNFLKRQSGSKWPIHGVLVLGLFPIGLFPAGLFSADYFPLGFFPTGVSSLCLFRARSFPS